MKTYIFRQLNSSTKRGCNVTIEVYRVKINKTSYLGCSHHNTGSWYGAKAQACQIIAKEDGHKMKGSYHLLSKNIQLFEI